ncbi:DUF6351 family protein [Paraburkholderia xenovorans]|uniref:DUF6351 family protein n=1 Tax=Paraburkholderia xenovorans TaxID=36873 RepID=UPI0038B7CD4A
MLKKLRILSCVVSILLTVLLAGCGGSDSGSSGVSSGGTTSTSPASSPGTPSPRAVIKVLSNRADLVSGGEALVEVDAPTGVDPRTLYISLNGVQDVRQAFSTSADGRFMGLVKGMTVGENALTVEGPTLTPSTMTIVNHPAGGPIFAGPQLQPWICQPGAVDAQCNQPPSYSWVYLSSDPTKSGFQPYNLAAPPKDVATTTTDQGVTVPFIVRIETGYQDRNQYQIAVLFQPNTPWSAVNPQAQFNRKLLIVHGALCGMAFKASNAPSVLPGDLSTAISLVGLIGLNVGPGSLQDPAYLALKTGYAVLSTAQSNSGMDCNVANQAESLMMAKEHLIDYYGTLRYTVGYGCSGGSLAEQWVQNAYPEIYQGLVVTCSFPDAWSVSTQVAEYSVLNNYFSNNASAPSTWSFSQKSAVLGGSNWNPDDASSQYGGDTSTLVNAMLYEAVYFPSIIPSNPTCAVSPQYALYSPSNPSGVRCSVADLSINLLGPRPKASWMPSEIAVGHGFAGAPFDNVGVQYGLWALQNSYITSDQFIDLNEHVGGGDIDGNISQNRIVADATTLSNAYRSGSINVANNLGQTPIINCVGPNGTNGSLPAGINAVLTDAAPLIQQYAPAMIPAGLLSGHITDIVTEATSLLSSGSSPLQGNNFAGHDAYRAFSMRGRLDKALANHNNYAIWSGPSPLFADSACVGTAFQVLDKWLGAVESDQTTSSVTQKIAAHKPANAIDGCWDGQGNLTSGKVCGSGTVPIFQTPRMVAGDDISTYNNKCQLKPLSRGDYKSGQFTDDQWARLQNVFPSGVCDFSKPGVGQTNTVPWMTYQKADGSVIYGGTPLPPPPTNSGGGWASPAFKPFSM